MRTGTRVSLPEWFIGRATGLLQGTGLGILAILVLTSSLLTFDDAHAQVQQGCRTAGNNIFCNTCADAQNEPIANRQVTLSPNVTPAGGTQGSNNSFCDIANLNPGDSLDLTVEDTGSADIASFEVDFTRVGAIPPSLMPVSMLDVMVAVPNGSTTQSFAHSEAGPTATRVNANIADTQPIGQQPSVSGTVTCSCTPATGTLKIIKVAEGGDDTFPITATLGQNVLDYTIMTAGGMGMESKVVPIGTYTVAETPPAGWELVSIVCGGQTTDQATVVNNQTTECTVTNRKLSKVTIKKQTVNGVGDFAFTNTTFPAGQAQLADFSQDTTVNNPSTGQVFTNILPGDYTFTETPPGAGWTLTNLTCTQGATNVGTNGFAGSFTLEPGADVVCTYVNTRALGNLKVNKIAAGGGATQFDFEIRDDQNALVGAGFDLADGQMETRNGLPTGQYTITETNLPAGWSLDSISACGQRNGDTVTVDVVANQTTECTFTNVNQVGSLKVTKQTIGGNDNFDFEVRDAGNAVVGTANALANGDMQTFTPLAPGNYTIEELNIPAGWTLTGVDCGQLNGNEVTVAVVANQTTECTFTNTLAPASLTIVKNVPGTGDTTSFSFSNNGPQAPANFSLADGQSRTFNTVGTYVITEAQTAGYSLTQLSCRGTGANGQGDSTSLQARRATVQLDPGDNITCTYRNVRQTGTLSIRKATIGGDGTFSFSVSGQGTFTLKNGGLRRFTNLTIGQYTIRETNLPQGWTLQNVNCTGGGTRQGNGITVNLSNDQAITCTFTNFKERDERMRDVTRLFIHRRVDNLLTHGPDRARLLRRLQPTDPPACGLKDDCSGNPPPLKLGARSALGAGSTLGEAGSSGTPRLGGVGTPQMPNFGGQALGQNPFANPAYGQHKSNGPGGLFANETDDQPWNPSGATSSPLLSTIMGQLQGAASGSSSFKFGTSLSQLRESAAAAQVQDEQKKLKAAGLGYHGQNFGMPKSSLYQRFDFWVEGQVSRYDDSTGGIKREGDFRVLYVGADYAVARGILIGALVQVDDTREDIDDPTLIGEVEGTGWMAGPYIGIRLADNLFFDARVAWGQSDNDIWLQDNEAGRRKGSFDTNRWLASATLTGNYQFRNWRISPEIGLAYGDESYDTYRNSLGQIVDGGEASIGRFTGGAEVGYQIRRRDGSILEPHIGLKGIWNFHTEDLVVGGVVVDTDENRARLEGGLSYRTPNGWALRGAAAYDGIGADDFESYSGQLWLNIPLN